MAALEKIRNRAGILISIVIGLALLSFILGDLFRGGPIQSDRFEIAEIKGKSVDYRNYQQRIEKAIENVKRNQGVASLDEQTTYQVQDEVWEQLVQEYVMEEELDQAGIAVSTEELKDMVVGNDIHPQIKRIPIFQNQQTGQFDVNLVKQFIATLDQSPENEELWFAFEQGLKQERVNNKYYTAIQKGIYITDLQAETEAIDKQKKVDIKYVSVPLSDLKDEEVNITEQEVEEYYEKNLAQFKQEKSVDIEYVVIPVVASEKDIEATKAEVDELIPELKEIEDHYQYVKATSDGDFDGKYYVNGEYEDKTIDSVMFAEKEGFVYGPYRDGESFKITKLAHIEERPDTIHARHIALVPNETMDAVKVQSLADSLTKLIENGANFAELAKKYSADPETADKGGDMGWKNVEELVYGQALLEAGVNETVSFPTNQAIFITQMVEMGKKAKQVQIATIERKIVPSEDTRDAIYRKANIFGANLPSIEEFNKGVEAAGLVKKQANNLKTTSRAIAGLPNARSIVRAAFSTDENEIILTQGQSQSPIFEIGENYVVGYVKKQYEEGTSPLADVKATVERAVKKQKKAELLSKKVADQLSSVDNLEDLAEKLEKTVKTSEGISFGGFSVPGLGIEPKVQGAAIAMELNQMSDPIEGNNGVFVIEVTNVVEPTDLNIEMQKNSLERTYVSRVQREVFDILKENANIDDNRIKFY